MTKRLLCPPAPGPLEAYAERFDDCLGTVAQRRGFREYLQGLLLPRDRHKTLTGLVGTEPVDGAQAPSAQRLQFFLSESTWDAEAITRRRLELVVAEPATAPHAGGVLVIDDSGIVAVTSLWAEERISYPLRRGAEALLGDLGAGRCGPHAGGGRAGAAVGRPRRAGRLDAGRAAVPRRPRGDLVGRRPHLWPVWTEQDPPRRGGHD
jgi:hypothetical protein